VRINAIAAAFSAERALKSGEAAARRPAQYSLRDRPSACARRPAARLDTCVADWARTVLAISALQSWAECAASGRDRRRLCWPWRRWRWPCAWGAIRPSAV